MKNVLIAALLFTIPAFSHAMKPRNECGRGNKIVASWVCADAETGGSYSLGAFVICSQKKNGMNVGYTSLLDDNVVVYGGGYNWGVVTRSNSSRLVISSDDGEADVLDFRTGLAKLQNQKMKCTASQD